MSKISELREYIERKLVLAKLDSALLFFSSSLSLAFGVGYGFLGAKWLQYYLPMLLLGWFMPVYIGYVRGSLIEDSVEERVRGWIYFTIGLGFYIASPFLGTFVKDDLKLGVYSILVIPIPSFIIGYSLGIFYSRVIYDIFKIQSKDLREEVKQAFMETRHSAVLLAVLLSSLFTFDWSKFYERADLWTNVVEIVWILLLGAIIVLIITSERKARKLLRNTERL